MLRLLRRQLRHHHGVRANKARALVDVPAGADGGVDATASLAFERPEVRLLIVRDAILSPNHVAHSEVLPRERLDLSVCQARVPLAFDFARHDHSP